MNKNVSYALKAWPFICGVLLVAGLHAGEKALFPVVEDFVVTSMVKEPGYVVMSGYMRKSRDCQFLGVTAEVNVGTSWADVPLQFLDTTNHTATRPTGTQLWGPWRVTIPISTHSDTVRLMATHKCHPAWLSTSALATIPLKAD